MSGDQPWKRMYSRREAAVYLACSVPELDRKIAASDILALKDGRRVLIDVSELDAYIDRLPSLEPKGAR